MALAKITSVRIDGISACVPSERSSYARYEHLFSRGEYEKLERLTGISCVRIPNKNCTPSDMCLKAAEKLLEDMHIDKNEIDLLVFVSQSPDYLAPMTSCILQDRMSLSKQCIAFDVTSGCSGYVQGLNIVASMISSGRLRRGLLLAGDTLNVVSPNDKTTYPLFGAAGSATLLSFDPTAGDLFFESGTDGSGYGAIIVPDGGARHPFDQSSLIEHKVSDGVARSGSHLIMNGQEVFSFAISEVPDSIERLYAHFGLDIAETDYFIFHQANKLILETIADVLSIPMEKIPLSLSEYGNTSSATIPLTIVSTLGSINKPTRLCLCGFGVGLSWGSLHVTTDSMHCCPLIEID